MFKALRLYWGALKEEHNRQVVEKATLRFLQQVPKRPEVITEELTYPIYKVVETTKTRNLSKLPIMEVKGILRVTQLSCKPLEFVPTYKYTY